jgi:hypothetical protein
MRFGTHCSNRSWLSAILLDQIHTRRSICRLRSFPRPTKWPATLWIIIGPNGHPQFPTPWLKMRRARYKPLRVRRLNQTAPESAPPSHLVEMGRSAGAWGLPLIGAPFELASRMRLTFEFCPLGSSDSWSAPVRWVLARPRQGTRRCGYRPRSCNCS